MGGGWSIPPFYLTHFPMLKDKFPVAFRYFQHEQALVQAIQQATG